MTGVAVTGSSLLIDGFRWADRDSPAPDRRRFRFLSLLDREMVNIDPFLSYLPVSIQTGSAAEPRKEAGNEHRRGAAGQAG